MSDIELMGAPGSPYTRKMLALMRYRHIAYKVRWQTVRMDDETFSKDRPKPKVPLLPTYYLPDEKGEIQAVTDSSPILRRFEDEFEGRSVIPSDAVLAFLNWLMEDYGDEWLNKIMFRERWGQKADRDAAAERAMEQLFDGNLPRAKKKTRDQIANALTHSEGKIRHDSSITALFPVA